ncbi:MAG: RNase adapter RapZ [Thermodesulfobacteriota bacterium]|nr:RNase adapter RapZ [Thermodesulfobacteriota bacterium]
MANPYSIIVTGLSGSGKSTALKTIEDAGFFCMDNIPIDLLVKMIEMYDFTSLNISNRICIGVDVRAGGASFVSKAPYAISLLREFIGEVRLVFMEADREHLINRFKETRRRHPLGDGFPTLIDAIDAEVDMMSPIRELADFIVDTSEMNVHGLKEHISEILCKEGTSMEMSVEVSSFGFKNGVPLDADMVMDLRFLPNPYFVEGLRDKTGMDEEVKTFLHSSEIYAGFIKRLEGLIGFVLPLCKKEGRAYLHIALGCTGGRHRSVAAAEEVMSFVERTGFRCNLVHRDIPSGGS